MNITRTYTRTTRYLVKLNQIVPGIGRHHSIKTYIQVTNVHNIDVPVNFDRWNRVAWGNHTKGMVHCQFLHLAVRITDCAGICNPRFCGIVLIEEYVVKFKINYISHSPKIEDMAAVSV